MKLIIVLADMNRPLAALEICREDGRGWAKAFCGCARGIGGGEKYLDISVSLIGMYRNMSLQCNAVCKECCF
jgi:hypothetical protein